jgi:hypothetical protein
MVVMQKLPEKMNGLAPFIICTNAPCVVVWVDLYSFPGFPLDMEEEF